MVSKKLKILAIVTLTASGFGTGMTIFTTIISRLGKDIRDTTSTGDN